MSLSFWLGVAEAKAAGSTSKGLSFKDKQLSLDNAEQAKVIVNAINACKDLEAIDLGGNTLSLKACEAVAAALATKPTMRYAMMDDMFTRRKQDEIHPALSRFSDALMRANCLTYLDMSDNALNQNGANSIKPLISTCLSLETLYLNNTGVGPAGGVIVGEALYAAYEAGKKVGRPYRLRHFVLGRSRLENPGAIAVSKALKAIGTLEEIRMNNNGIYIEGLMSVIAMVGANPILKVLDLSDNALKVKGAKALAKSLKNCSKLQQLILDTTLLRDAGTMALLETIKDLKDLTQVDLSYNEFTKQVGQHAMQVFSGLTKLNTLKLNGNELGETLCSALQSRFDSILGSMSDNEDSGEEQDDDGDDDNGDDEGDDDAQGEDDDAEVDEVAQELNETIIRNPAPAKPNAAQQASTTLTQQFSSLMSAGTSNSSTTTSSTAKPKKDFAALATSLLKESDTKTVLQGFVCDEQDYMTLLFEVLSKCDAAVKAANETRAIDGLLAAAFAAGVGMKSSVMNEYLVRLLLIKGEHKLAPASPDLLAKAWLALLHVVQQAYLPKELATVIESLATDESIQARLKANPKSHLASGPYAKPGGQLNDLRAKVVEACRRRAA